jgi:cellulose biosynthesis protein BcsQ
MGWQFVGFTGGFVQITALSGGIPIMTRVFVFTNHKGGVGKSTSATHTALGIAGMLRRAGAPNARVLLIDTDSQAHATLVIGKINDIREGWRQPNLRVSGILITKMNARIRGHNHLLNELKNHSILGKLVVGVIPANEAVSYAHQNHQSVFNYDPQASASKAYAQFVGRLVQRLAKEGV